MKKRFMDVRDIDSKKGIGEHRKLQKIIEEFANSDSTALQLIPEEGEYVSVHSMAGAFRVAIRRSKHSFAVAERGDCIYLIKNI